MSGGNKNGSGEVTISEFSTARLVLFQGDKQRHNRRCSDESLWFL